jgi:dihydrodipicolinate synthase/N-acetylneuraminate lyase
MPGCHVTDVMVALWKALENGDEAQAFHIYKELSPLFFFEAQVEGCYKEVLFRRGIIDCPLKRNGATHVDEITSKYLDDLLQALEPLMSYGKARKPQATETSQHNGVLRK